MAKPKGNSRTQRVADLIQTIVAQILQQEAEELKIGMVTVTSVEVAHDLSHAKIFVSVLEDDRVKEILSKLNDASKYFRYALAQEAKLRIAPEIKFLYDDSIVRGNRISTLINDALKDSKSNDDE